LFDRNDNDRGDYRGMNREPGNRSREREGLWANSWPDGAWTADAADRTDRDWHLGQGRGPYDRDMRPAQAGWRAGGMSGGTGMNRGGMDRDRNWNLGGGDRDWGHNWGSGNAGGGYGGMDRDREDRGGFMDRAQNAVRRGWDRVEETFDRDEGRGHMGAGSMRGGTSWAGRYDREYGPGYRDEGRYGARSDLDRGYGATGGYGGTGYTSGMNRYGADYDRGYRSRQQIDNGDPYGDRVNRTPIRVVEGNRGARGRYDENFRGDRNWF
ncbi:MAG: hypothetical protein KY467_11455, partial [Gemmatimonadetes bacterium]|nr:hypothetical protein [Gemmatimonadota bacterium]